MPTYDAACAECQHETVVAISLAALAEWDRDATCPNCAAAYGRFRRIIKNAAAFGKGVNPVSARTGPQGVAGRKRAFNSVERDEMRHRASKRVDADQVRAEREGVAKGEWEGF